MTGKVLGIAFSLLLLASVNQGYQHAGIIRNEPVEAMVGQNVTLPCVMENVNDLRIVNIEWKKNEDTKLGVYNPSFGPHFFWPNITMEIQKNDAGNLLGSNLILPSVSKWDGGIYVCEIMRFPLNSVKMETNLTVKDELKVTCDADVVIEVNYGENATVHCTASSDAQYRWTKNETLVSQETFLELLRVTDTGVYKLTVNTGDQTLHRDFRITVLPATTSLTTDSVTMSTQGVTASPNSSFTTQHTTALSTQADWTTHPNTHDVTVTPAEDTTPSAGLVPASSISSSPDAHPSTHNSLNLTTSSDNSSVFGSARGTVSKETRNAPRSHTQTPEECLSSSKETISEHPHSTAGDVREVAEGGNKGARRTHLFLALIIISLVLVIAVLAFLKMRQIKKERMDLPPPFKPPPPPVKYTAARRNETLEQLFPTSRCNSIAGPMYMPQTYV